MNPSWPTSGSSRGLNVGFSSLGCPELDLVGLRQLAAAHGIRWIELRSLGGSLDFPRQLARFPGGAPGARDFLLEAGVRVRLVGSSFLLTRATPGERHALVAEAEAGEALGAKWLRVFGGGQWGDLLTDEAVAIARGHREWWKALRTARGWTIDLIFELHDAFSGTPPILEFFEQSGGPMPLLWDAHHTWKIGRELPAVTWQKLHPYIQHIHVKDSVTTTAEKSGYAYVAPGHGEFPLGLTLDLLHSANFTGLVSLEWEKHWHPKLAQLATILPGWNRTVAHFQRARVGPLTARPTLLFKADFDRTQLVPSAGPYFHGAREQYEDLEGVAPSSSPSGLGEPTPENPRLGKFRIYYEGGNETQRSARLVPDETNPGNTVLRFRLTEPNVTIHWPEGPQRKSRVQAELYGNIELREFSQLVRLRFLPGSAKLRDFPGKIDWFTLMEFWNQAGWTDEPYPFRFGLHLVKPDPAPGTDLFFATAAQHQVDAKTYKDVWHATNQAIPVAFGIWMTLEVYFKEGDAHTGRFSAAVTLEGGPRTTLFDIHGFTHHPENPAPTGLKQFSPIKLYTSAEVVDFLEAQGTALELDWDDLELWNGRTPDDPRQ